MRKVQLTIKETKTKHIKKNKHYCWCMDNKYACHCGRPMGERGYHSTYVWRNKLHKMCYSCAD